MTLNTCSEGISFAKKIENDSSAFYEALAQNYPKHADTFLVISKENKKYISQIERAYFGVITDAIEGCYAFNLEPEDYTFDVNVSKIAGETDAVDKALNIESIIIKFYKDAAEQSKSLMADVPRAFLNIVKKREARKSKLNSLLNDG